MFARASARTRGLRGLTTQTTITDHLSGRVIKLTDPNRPELADYPNPEPVLAQSKSPYATYDFPQLRRNFKEPMNIDDDLYDMWSPDYFQFVSDKTALKHNGVFFGAILAFAGAIYYFQLDPEKPAMPRSYPFNGLAKALGSGSDEADAFYQVRPDADAETAGFLAADPELERQRQAYVADNAEFLRAV